MNKAILIILLSLNIIVLMGQIIPDKAPPFARTVNIVFLVGSVLFFLSSLLLSKKK